MIGDIEGMMNLAAAADEELASTSDIVILRHSLLLFAV